MRGLLRIGSGLQIPTNLNTNDGQTVKGNPPAALLLFPLQLDCCDILAKVDYGISNSTISWRKGTRYTRHSQSHHSALNTTWQPGNQ